MSRRLTTNAHYHPDMPNPFHYSFLVRDLASTRRFYGEILGCAEGRSTDTWVDFDFFGHQLSAHIAAAVPAPERLGQVDGIAVPMPHFGAVLEWSEFERLAARLRTEGVSFVIEPRLRFEGSAAEQALMFLTDFSGNALEFKSFRNQEGLFAR
jgi:extradiol dioxygenase family protein